MPSGLVIKAISSFFYVQTTEELIECRASKKLKQNKEQIITGDYVEFDAETNYITRVFAREHELIRPKLANVNQIILIFSAIEPDINFGLLDRMLLIMEKNQLTTKIVITKGDLLSSAEQSILDSNFKYYQEIGYQVFDVNKTTDFMALKKCLTADKYVFTGQTGVGKSTLINRIIPDLELKTQAISKALGRGKHTTRDVTFYDYQGGYIIDTPGFSALDIDLTVEDIRDNYIDFFIIAEACKFRGCYHLQEPHCAVKEKLGYDTSYDLRYNNYVKLMQDTKEKR